MGLNTQRSALGSPYQAMGLVVAGNCREREKSSRAVVLYRGMERKSAWLVVGVGSELDQFRVQMSTIWYTALFSTATAGSISTVPVGS